MGIAVVYNSSWPAGNTDAHCTLSYLGKVEEATFSKSDVWMALSAMKWPALTVKVSHFEMFGENLDIPVMVLDSNILHILKKRLDEELAKAGIEVVSNFSEYRPHVSIPEGYDPDGIQIPKTINLSGPEVFWS